MRISFNLAVLLLKEMPAMEWSSESGNTEDLFHHLYLSVSDVIS